MKILMIVLLSILNILIESSIVGFIVFLLDLVFNASIKTLIEYLFIGFVFRSMYVYVTDTYTKIKSTG